MPTTHRWTPRLRAGFTRPCATSAARTCRTTPPLGETGTAAQGVEARFPSRLLLFRCKESPTMRFYIKRYLSLEVGVTLLLGGFGYGASDEMFFRSTLRPSPQVVALGLAGSLWWALWTGLGRTVRY